MMLANPLYTRLPATPPMSRFFDRSKMLEGCEFFYFLDRENLNQTYFLQNGYTS
jgi:hypothetical protein